MLKRASWTNSKETYSYSKELCIQSKGLVCARVCSHVHPDSTLVFTGLFWLCKGLFWVCIGLFWACIGLFGVYIGLFWVYLCVCVLTCAPWQHTLLMAGTKDVGCACVHIQRVCVCMWACVVSEWACVCVRICVCVCRVRLKDTARVCLCLRVCACVCMGAQVFCSTGRAICVLYTNEKV